jgi:hypothetical protein
MFALADGVAHEGDDFALLLLLRDSSDVAGLGTHFTGPIRSNGSAFVADAESIDVSTLHIPPASTDQNGRARDDGHDVLSTVISTSRIIDTETVTSAADETSDQARSRGCSQR